MTVGSRTILPPKLSNKNTELEEPRYPHVFSLLSGNQNKFRENTITTHSEYSCPNSPKRRPCEPCAQPLSTPVTTNEGANSWLLFSYAIDWEPSHGRTRVMLGRSGKVVCTLKVDLLCSTGRGNVRLLGVEGSSNQTGIQQLQVN